MSGDEELMKWKAEKEAQRAVSASRSGNVVWCGVRACVCVRACVRAFVFVCPYACKYTYIHSYMCTFVHTHVCVCVCVCVCVYL